LYAHLRGAAARLCDRRRVCADEERVCTRALRVRLHGARYGGEPLTLAGRGNRHTGAQNRVVEGLAVLPVLQSGGGWQRPQARLQLGIVLPDFRRGRLDGVVLGHVGLGRLDGVVAARLGTGWSVRHQRASWAAWLLVGPAGRRSRRTDRGGATPLLLGSVGLCSTGRRRLSPPAGRVARGGRVGARGLLLLARLGSSARDARRRRRLGGRRARRLRCGLLSAWLKFALARTWRLRAGRSCRRASARASSLCTRGFCH
ncbi:uncharacterized protein C8Q71DRAFT_875639, partial [Rhodofomes roseus]